MVAIKIRGSFAACSAHGAEVDESQHIRIACAQVLPSDEGMCGKGGLDKLKAFSREAARKGADVVVFPEYFLTGATHDLWHAVRKMSRDRDPTHPDSDPDHFLSIIADVAMENNIDIVAGTVVELGKHHIPHRLASTDHVEIDSDAKDDAHHAKLFNTAYYVNREGKIAGRYTKRNLWHPEKSVLSPGHELIHATPSTFEIRTRRGAKLRAGLRICWDLAFPESFRDMFDLGSDKLSLTGPDIVFAPICWYATDAGQRGLRWNKDSESALLDSLCLTRAIENECIVAMTNVAGPTSLDTPAHEWTEDDAVAVGRSCVCAPFLNCVDRIESGDEELLLASIDLRVLQDARSVYRCREDIKKVLLAGPSN